MMFGSWVKYCVTFKSNQRSFDIHRRKFDHDFKINVLKTNIDGSKGLALESENTFMVTDRDVINFYDASTYKEIEK